MGICVARTRARSLSLSLSLRISSPTQAFLLQRCGTPKYINLKHNTRIAYRAPPSHGKPLPAEFEEQNNIRGVCLIDVLLSTLFGDSILVAAHISL